MPKRGTLNPLGSCDTVTTTAAQSIDIISCAPGSTLYAAGMYDTVSVEPFTITTTVVCPVETTLNVGARGQA